MAAEITNYAHDAGMELWGSIFSSPRVEGVDYEHVAKFAEIIAFQCAMICEDKASAGHCTEMQRMALLSASEAIRDEFEAKAAP